MPCKYDWQCSTPFVPSLMRANCTGSDPDAAAAKGIHERTLGQAFYKRSQARNGCPCGTVFPFCVTNQSKGFLASHRCQRWKLPKAELTVAVSLDQPATHAAAYASPPLRPELCVLSYCHDDVTTWQARIKCRPSFSTGALISTCR